MRNNTVAIFWKCNLPYHVLSSFPWRVSARHGWYGQPWLSNFHLQLHHLEGCPSCLWPSLGWIFVPITVATDGIMGLAYLGPTTLPIIGLGGAICRKMSPSLGLGQGTEPEEGRDAMLSWQTNSHAPQAPSPDFKACCLGGLAHKICSSLLHQVTRKAARAW